MKSIFVIASELSVITGHNKYEEPSKVIDKILNRNKIAKRYIPKSKIEEQLLTLDKTNLEFIKTELKLDTTATLKQIEDMIKQQILYKALNENISEDESKKKTNDVLKSMPVLNKCLESSVEQDLRMRRGNIKENSNLNKTQTKQNIVIEKRNSQMYEKQLYIDPDRIFSIIIRGKCDGEIKDECIVETKNRRNKLFNAIPDYEKVQLNAYMFMTSKEKSLHIECYNEEQNSTEYDFDKLFWDDCSEKIINFVKENIVCYL
tara:strand:+ start:7691 stop:8473 length:783 start_codon:yes stop_codon:yes gene_type:complete